jgi:signal transduction histidine kinase
MWARKRHLNRCWRQTQFADKALFQGALRDGFSGGYSRDAFWFKFKLDAQDYPDGVLLQAQPTYLDYVTLYWPDERGVYHAYELGDQLAFTDRYILTRGFVFPLELADGARTGYLRLKTDSSAMLLLQAWQPQAFYSQNHREYFYFALIIGIGLSLLFFNSLQILGLRDPAFHVFMLFLVVQVLAVVVINGFASEFLFASMPQVDSMMVGVVTMLLLITISLGHYYFLNLSWRDTPILFSLTWGGIGLGIVGVLAALLDFYVIITPLIGMYAIVLYLAWVVYGLKRVMQRDAYAHWVVLASLSGIFSSVAMIFVLLGWLSVEHTGLYAYQLGSLFAVVSFQMIVSGKMREALGRNRQLMVEKLAAKKLVQQEQKKQREQSQFIAMLTHEIKTPLSVIQIALSNLQHRLQPHALSAIADINNVLERCVISEKYEANTMQQQLERIEWTAWLQVLIEYFHVDKARVRYAQGGDAIFLQSDVTFLKIIFNNLIENALKYSPANTPVTIEWQVVTQRDGAEQLQISVRNLVGREGVPDSEKLFDKYYRAPGAQRTTGSGLGLYLVRELVEVLKGRIEFTTNQTEVIFTLYFPLVLEKT